MYREKCRSAKGEGERVRRGKVVKDKAEMVKRSQKVEIKEER